MRSGELSDTVPDVSLFKTVATGKLRCGLVLLLALVVMATSTARAASAPRTIRVGLDDNYAPYVFKDEKGMLQGILVDQWRLWEKKTGIAVRLEAMDWGEALRRMRAGGFDVIDTIFQTEEREAIYDFTPAYARIEVPIFFRKEISGITDLDSLRGFAVAAKTGDHAADQLVEHGVGSLLRFHNYEAIVTAAKERRTNVFVIDAPPAFYLLNKLGIADEFRRSAPINVGEFHRAVRKGDEVMLRTVMDGFAQLTPAELRAIDEKWFGQSLGGRRYQYLVYASYVAAAALLVIGGLVVWNRTLRRMVARRTAELRESEARFRQVVENIQEVFWLCDATKAGLIYVSPAYEKVWGRTAASLHANPDSWLDGVHPEDRARVQAAMIARFGGAPYDQTYRVVRPDGTTRWVHDRAFSVEDAPGDARHVVGVAEDITERKSLEEQFLRGQRMEALGMLSGGIAHDLNNILAPILLSIELLRATSTNPNDRRTLELLETNTKRGAELLRQLLIFSRGTAGERTTVSAPVLLEEVLKIVRTTFPRSIAVHTEIEPGLPPLLADATQLHQVLLNLCVNARDAMPNGGTLTLRARLLEAGPETRRAQPTAKAGRYLVLETQDTGVGIPRELVDRIFEPFFTTKGVGKGSGLGLSTVLGIVKSHGGFVTVDSEPGTGSRFAVHLPVADAPAPQPAGAERGENIEGRGELVLVVDDEPLVREMTAAGLTQRGFRVITAGEGAEALKLFAEHREEVRVVVTDVMMPGMDGVSLVRGLRTKCPDLRVIAVTGMTTDGHVEQLAGLGVHETLHKPYEMVTLVRALRRVI